MEADIQVEVRKLLKESSSPLRVMKEDFQRLVSFMQRKGFVWGPEPEIYGGLAGFYTYAPLGKALKNNVESEIRRLFGEQGFLEVECPTIMQRAVWEASGHLEGFTDPLAECPSCKKHYKADAYKDCPSCGKPLRMVGEHNLMMKTTVGLNVEAYNRPETATTTYLPFLRYDNFFRGKYPFGVFQIGKAYRNEISPRQHLLRMREFTQAEAQLFILPGQKKSFPQYKAFAEQSLPFLPWELQEKEEQPKKATLAEALRKGWLGSEAYAWALSLAYRLFVGIGIPEQRLRVRQHGPEEKAFYAADAWDVEVLTKSFGWVECCGVHDRTDYDLKQHSKHSGQELAVKIDGEKVVPHILEVAFGVDRPVFALMDVFYDYKEEGEGKSALRLPPRMSPFKAAVLPLMRKPELVSKARLVYQELKTCFPVTYDETASIGKRYLRASEEGTPWCVTIDYQTLEDDTVTIRERDTEEQVRVKASELKDKLYALLTGTPFKSLANEKL